MALALLALGQTAAAQPPPGGAPPPPPSATAVETPIAPPDDAARAEALARFNKGIELRDRGALAEALAEFLASRRLYPTRNATINAASSLRELQRYDEALDFYEAALREFLEFPEDQKAAVDAAMEELRGLVGTIAVEGGEPGGSLIVDGRFRGILPLTEPLRVNAGRHEVRAYKEGFDPFGATVEVRGRQRAVARLRSQSTGGRLQVREQRGRVLDVVVNGNVVGKTPWEGTVPVGEHLVLLRGYVEQDAADCSPAGEGEREAALSVQIELGTQPVSVPVKLHALTPLTLTAEELDTTLRVEPTPAGASVAIDSVTVGRGIWEGRLRVGAHTVEVMADGFLPVTRRVKLERRKRQVVSIVLERDRRGWEPGSLVPAGVAYGIGAAGLGVFAVTGILAATKLADVRSRCRENLCPDAEADNLATVSALATASNVGLAVGVVGVAAGTVLLVWRPGGSDARAGDARGGAVWTAGLGFGRLDVNGRF